MLKKIGEFSLPPTCSYSIYDIKKYYPGEPVNINIRSLINFIQEKNWFITTKKVNCHYFMVMDNEKFPSMAYGGYLHAEEFRLFRMVNVGGEPSLGHHRRCVEVGGGMLTQWD